MERRSLEMIAEGMSLGDSFSISVGKIDRSVHLGGEFNISITCIPEKDGSVPRSLKPDNGVDATCSVDQISGDEQENGSTVFNFPVTLSGTKGPSIFKLIFKGEEYKATLALAEINLDVHPAGLLVSLSDEPFRWDGISPGTISIKIINQGGSKVKVIPRSFLQDKGGRRLIEVLGKKMVIHRESSISIPLKNIEDIKKGPMDICVQLEVDGELRSHMIENGVLIVSDPSQEIEISTPVVSGEGLLIKYPGPINSDSILSARIGKDIELDLQEKKTLQDGTEFRFSLNEVPVGPADLSIMVDERRILEKEISIIAEETRFDIRARCTPQSLLAGEEGRFILDLDPVPEIMGSKCFLKLTIPSFREIDLGVVSNDGHIEHEVQVPTSSKTGDVGCTLRFQKEDDLVHEWSIPRLISVRSRGGLELKIMLPGQGEAGARNHLFPGEVVISSREHSGLVLSHTSTGRSIITRDGSLIPENDDEGEMGSRTILLDTYMDALLSGRSISKMRDIFLETGKMIEREYDLKDIAIGEDEKGFIGYLADHFSNSERDPTLIVHSEDGKDPVINISLLIKELTGAGGISPGGHPDRSLRDLVEKNIKTIKGRRNMADRKMVLFVINEISRRGNEALVTFGEITSRRSIDTDKVSISLRSVLFYLLVYSLVRVEMVSRWSDPIVSTWDDLRIERQRAIKSSIQATLDTVSMIEDIYRAAKQRWKAYQKNVISRNMMQGIKKIEVSRSREDLSGMAGDVWDIRLTVKAPEKCPPIVITPNLSLPRGGWSLESPRSIRQGDLLVLSEEKMKSGERRDIELKIRSPATAGERERSILYLQPNNIELEEEP